MDVIQELRSYRVHNIAVLDLASSFVVIGLLNKHFGTGSFVEGAIASIPIGIIAHWYFGVNTELNYKLGISGAPERETSENK